jgi:hypothetical protein
VDAIKMGLQGLKKEDGLKGDATLKKVVKKARMKKVGRQ